MTVAPLFAPTVASCTTVAWALRLPGMTAPTQTAGWLRLPSQNGDGELATFSLRFVVRAHLGDASVLLIVA